MLDKLPSVEEARDIISMERRFDVDGSVTLSDGRKFTKDDWEAVSLRSMEGVNLYRAQWRAAPVTDEKLEEDDFSSMDLYEDTLHGAFTNFGHRVIGDSTKRVTVDIMFVGERK